MNNIAISTTDAKPLIVTVACQVINVTRLSSNTFQVELRSLEDAPLCYTAGHYLKLELDIENDGKPLSLFYSIANDFKSTQPNRIQLFIQNTSDLSGQVLRYLSKQAANNANVSVTLPMGQSFLQTNLSRPHVLIAAGSGIAKIKCLTEAIVRQNPNADVKVYWSNRNIDDFYLLDEFQSLVNQYENFSFTPILETSDSNWFGRTGYIYKVIQWDFKNLDGAQLYLCGSPNMVYGTIDKLKFNGVKIENCYSDVFEYAPRELSGKFSI